MGCLFKIQSIHDNNNISNNKNVELKFINSLEIIMNLVFESDVT